MEKTYFDELVELVNSIKTDDKATNYIMEDCMNRALSWRESHEEYQVEWENDPYIKRQLDFLTQCLNK